MLLLWRFSLWPFICNSLPLIFHVRHWTENPSGIRGTLPPLIFYDCWDLCFCILERCRKREDNSNNNKKYVNFSLGSGTWRERKRDAKTIVKTWKDLFLRCVCRWWIQFWGSSCSWGITCHLYLLVVLLKL